MTKGSPGLYRLLHGPEEKWPASAKEATALHQFLRYARDEMIEARPLETGLGGVQWAHGPTRDEEETMGLPDYRHTTWLDQQLISYECETPRLATDLIFLLIQ